MIYPPQHPIQKAMAECRGRSRTGVSLCFGRRIDARYGSLPLVHQPGEKWLYHSGSDILGVLIARASGRTLGAFLHERIFAPLGMKDTGFSVPHAGVGRLATCYWTDQATGTDSVFDEARGGRFASPPVFESGGGGLVSTADDYLAFGRMMLNKGKLGSERVLSRLAIELMTTDHITPEQKAASPFFPGFWDNRGWGFVSPSSPGAMDWRMFLVGMAGTRLWHVGLYGPHRGHGGHTHDPASVGFPRRPGRLSRFLDLRVPGHR